MSSNCISRNKVMFTVTVTVLSHCCVREYMYAYEGESRVLVCQVPIYYKCANACMCACMHLCMYVYIYIYTYIMSVHVCLCMCVCVYIYISTHKQLICAKKSMMHIAYIS
jgi:hypothetical protein